MLDNPDVLTDEFLEFYDHFTKTDLWTKMVNTVENSPYHREANVAEHTNMVLNAAKLFNPTIEADFDTFSLVDQNVLAVALLFHDVGKPIARTEKISVKDDGSARVYYIYSGHEQISARLFMDFYFEHVELFAKFRFTRAQLYYIQWLIERHLPYGMKDEKNKRLAVEILATSEYASVNPAIFFCHLYADAKGRTSDEPHQYQNSGVTQWITALAELMPTEFKLDHLSPVVGDKHMHILVGPSGSGKSTTTASLLRQAEYDGKKCCVYSLDLLRLALYSVDADVDKITFEFMESFVPDHSTYAKSYDCCMMNQAKFSYIADKYLHEIFRRGYDVIIDNTNVSRKARKKYVSLASQNKYFISGIYFMASKKALQNSALKRTDKSVPESAVNSQHRSIQVPCVGSEVHDLYVVYRDI